MKTFPITAVVCVAVAGFLLSGCGESEPKTVDIKFSINGKPVDFDAIEKRKKDEPAAAAMLAKWKEKRFDEKGEFRNKVWVNITGAAAELSNITFNHPDTPTAKEAARLQKWLEASKADARDKGIFPTLPASTP